MSQGDEPLGSNLRVQEILQAAGPSSFTRKQRRSRELLLEALNDASDDVKAWVAQASHKVHPVKLTRQNLKRAAKATRDAARKRRKAESSDCIQPLESSIAASNEVISHDRSLGINQSPQADRNVDHFLDLPTEDEVKQRHWTSCQ